MVGCETTKPAEMSQTQDSPPARLAIALSNWSRTGSASALSFTASSAAASADNGSASNGADSQQLSVVWARYFDTDRY